MEPNQSSQINYTPLKIDRPKRSFQLLILFSCAFLIGNIIGLTIYIIKANQNSSPLKSSVKAAVNEDLRPDAIQIVETSSTSSKLIPQEPVIYGTINKFTSYQLGITFNYLTHWWEKTDSLEDKPTDVFISRSVNKVCIAYNIPNSGENCASGQYLIMLKKDAKKSFKETIEENLLGNNAKDCIVNTYKSGEKEIAEVVPLTDKCPETYSKKSVQRYFQYDSKFPDRFVFVSLSQHPILADTNYNTWEKTLTFFNSK